MESNKTALVQQDASDVAQELAQCLHHAIENLPDTQRSDVRQRVRDPLQQAPSPQAVAEIVAILEPGFQKIQRGA